MMRVLLVVTFARSDYSGATCSEEADTDGQAKFGFGTGGSKATTGAAFGGCIGSGCGCSSSYGFG